jgi:hypothetical protein
MRRRVAGASVRPDCACRRTCRRNAQHSAREAGVPRSPVSRLLPWSKPPDCDTAELNAQFVIDSTWPQARSARLDLREETNSQILKTAWRRRCAYPETCGLLRRPGQRLGIPFPDHGPGRRVDDRGGCSRSGSGFRSRSGPDSSERVVQRQGCAPGGGRRLTLRRLVLQG